MLHRAVCSPSQTQYRSSIITARREEAALPAPPESGASLPSACRAPGPTPHTSCLTCQEDARPEVREGAGWWDTQGQGGLSPGHCLTSPGSGGIPALSGVLPLISRWAEGKKEWP